jgi:hypothetical protein
VAFTYNPLLTADAPVHMPVDSTDRPVLIIEDVVDVAVFVSKFPM